jgi:hypothetical protein
MTRDEIIAEIRAQMLEAQQNTVANPWNYADEDYYPHILSALRYIRVAGVATDAVWSDSDFTTDPNEAEGLAIAFRVTAVMLRGDLTNKLLDGELGLYFRTATDIIDTKTAANSFAGIAGDLDEQFFVLLAKLLSEGTDTVIGVFGEQTLTRG